MAHYTNFGLEVKTKLLGPPARTQAWLVEQVKESTGLYVDDSYISKILTGQRRTGSRVIETPGGNRANQKQFVNLKYHKADLQSTDKRSNRKENV